MLKSIRFPPRRRTYLGRELRFRDNRGENRTRRGGSKVDALFDRDLCDAKKLMCGIAGIMDLAGQRPAPPGVVQRMSRALTHRGPDEEGFLERPGISLASRRLSIVGLADG